jgi:hypothetical protein
LENDFSLCLSSRGGQKLYKRKITLLTSFCLLIRERGRKLACYCTVQHTQNTLFISM